MAREIYTNHELMERIAVISAAEEDRYSDIPNWDGGYLAESRSGAAVLLYFRDGRQDWFPISQLRRTEDKLSLYASYWVLDKRMQERK